METNNTRIHSIYAAIQKDFKNHPVCIESGFSHFIAILIRWNAQRKDGFFISCPSDLDTNKYLCEICLKNSQGALFTLDNNIHKIRDYEHLYSKFFRYYFLLHCLYNLRFCIFRFQLGSRKKQVGRLQALCAYQVPTRDSRFALQII